MMIKTIKILKHSQLLEKTLWLNLNAFLLQNYQMIEH